jgi:hypothetical protein
VFGINTPVVEVLREIKLLFLHLYYERVHTQSLFHVFVQIPQGNTHWNAHYVIQRTCYLYLSYSHQRQLECRLNT